MASKTGVSESEFYMWRAVFAFALVDNILSLEEQGVLRSYSNTVPFSPQQRKILNDDFKKPQDVVAMYNKITEIRHKERFCVLARTLAWCEGDMDRQEEIILKRVHCLKNDDGAEILRRSRDHAEDAYQQYYKAGIVGLIKDRPKFEMRI